MPWLLQPDRIFLGSFASPVTAARAHDVAALRMGSDEPSQQHGVGTNFPAAAYQEGLQETRAAGVADFVVALQRIGAFESQRGSRCDVILLEACMHMLFGADGVLHAGCSYVGVHQLGPAEWEARYEEPAGQDGASCA
jgi:hypothetical protein